MSLNGFYYTWFWGWANNTDASWSYAVNLPASYIRAYPVLQQHLENQGDDRTGVKLNIIEYVQNGSPFHGDWQIVHGPGFTNVTFGIYVNRCFGAGVGHVDVFS